MKGDVVAKMVSMLRSREREKLREAYGVAVQALAEYGRRLAEGEVPEATVQLAAEAATVALEYFIAAAVEGGREAVAEALARLDERLLVALAVRIVARGGPQ